MEHTTMNLEELKGMVNPRRPDGSKFDFGHALLVAGAYGMAGASVLAGRACLRSGVGKLTMHIPRCNNDIVQISVPEAVVRHDEAGSPFFSKVMDLRPYDAVGIGPGLGRDAATQQAFLELLQRLRTQVSPSLVVDADGLYALAQHPEYFSSLVPGTILTPHLGEFARLVRQPLQTLFENEGLRYRLAAKMAEKHQIVVVLKGHGTRIFSPDGREKCCPWGNDGMATAGSGDVLTGIILAMLALKHRPFEAACLGVGLHALSGDAVAERFGRHSLIASDLVDFLPEAFRRLGF